MAQNVTLRSEGVGLEVSGRYIGYDGENIQIESEFGPLTLRYDTVACEGEICPDATAYFPKLKLSGSRRMADLLMPALVEGFARSQGWVVATQQSDTTHFTHTMTAGDDPKPVARFSFRATSTDEGFADLIAHEADIVMSVRRYAQLRQNWPLKQGWAVWMRRVKAGLLALMPWCLWCRCGRMCR